VDSSPTDNELMLRIVQREREALRVLFSRYAPLMLAISRRILRDTHEAEDLVNEVMLEVWQKPDRFVPERGAPKTYLLLVTRSRSIDKLRKRKRQHGAGGGGAGQTWAEDAEGDEAAPSARLEGAETREQMRAVLSTLPVDQRDAIERVFFDGMTHRELAEDSGTPLGTVKSRVRLGLIRMREGLRNQSAKADVGRVTDTSGPEKGAEER
jgi:RNA polymerase sigma-70 factor (ECF subfamily)